MMNALPAKTVAQSSSIETRKDRRRHRRDAYKHSEAEAGPSRRHSPKRDHGHDHNHGPSRDGSEKKRRKRSKGREKEKPINGRNGSKESTKKSKTFEIGEDFVPFAPSSEDEERPARESRNDTSTHELDREWDRGKGKGRASDREYEMERDNGGTKRKYGLVFDDDELVDRRRDTVIRRAPWVTGIDWDSCKNVSQMCVFFWLSNTRLIFIALSQASSRGGSVRELYVPYPCGR